MPSNLPPPTKIALTLNYTVIILHIHIDVFCRTQKPVGIHSLSLVLKYILNKLTAYPIKNVSASSYLASWKKLNFGVSIQKFITQVKKKNCTAGFSLVEVTLAMGVVSFALITLIGLMGTGLNTFHAAIATSATSQIFQEVVNSAEQSDFNQLSTLNGTSTYFDDQGNLLSSSTGSVYQAYVTVSMATVLPGMSSNTRLATIEVQVARNPGNQVISNWSNPPTGISISTFSTYIGKAN